MLETGALYGTPKRVAEQIAALRDAGLGHVMCQSSWGGLPHDKVTASLRRCLSGGAVGGTSENSRYVMSRTGPFVLPTRWANALGSETAVRRGVGKVIADVRRGDGPPDAGRYTFGALTTTEALIAREPERVAAAVRAVVRTQRLLRKEPARATEVGRRRFPPAAADILATLVERDLPFYEPAIPEAAVATMNRFAQAIGLLAAPVAYEDVVATRFRALWSATS